MSPSAESLNFAGPILSYQINPILSTLSEGTHDENSTAGRVFANNLKCLAPISIGQELSRCYKCLLFLVPERKLTVQGSSTFYHIRIYGAKLLNADWLRQRAFFLNHEGTFGNEEGMIT